MTTPTVPEAIRQAYSALHRGDKRAVRHWAGLALAQEAAQEEPWLLLAAVSTPRASVEFLQRALQVNPNSERAQKGMDWALKRLREAESGHPPAEITQPARAQALTQPVRAPAALAVTQPSRAVNLPVSSQKPTKWGAVLFLLSILTCLLITALLFGGATSVRAFISRLIEPHGAVDWVTVEAAKAPGAAIPTLPQASPGATATPTQPLPPPSPTEAESPTPLPTPLPTELAYEPSPTPLPTDTTAPASSAPADAPAPNDESGKLILVDLSEQHMYVYENGTLLYSFVASTGMNGSTRIGTFSVLDKIPNAYGSTWNIWMPNWLGIYWSGHLENGIHALPILPNGQRLWSGYLGTPISYGCVVLGTYESELLYNWVDVGTPVIIQY